MRSEYFAIDTNIKEPFAIIVNFGAILNHYRLALNYQDTTGSIGFSDTLYRIGYSGETDTIHSESMPGLDTLYSGPQDSVEEVPSIFENHGVLPGSMMKMEGSRVNEDWITIHIVLALTVFAWTRIFYYNRLKQVFRSFFGIRFQGMMMREGNVLRERISIALMIVFLISASLAIYLVFTRLMEWPSDQLKSFRLFSLIMLIVIFFWILKNISNIIVGNVFQNPVILSDYLVTNFVFNIVTGSVLLPVLVLAVYVPSIEMVYLAAMIWVLFFLYRLIRLLVSSLSYTKFSLFNRILYLCTFEIAPIIVIIKLIMSNIEQ